jgi:hypothetical protein
MNTIITNWKTTLAGIVPILAALTDLATMASSSSWNGDHLLADLAALGTGIGLMLAKDVNFTGGGEQHVAGDPRFSTPFKGAKDNR